MWEQILIHFPAFSGTRISLGINKVLSDTQMDWRDLCPAFDTLGLSATILKWLKSHLEGRNSVVSKGDY